MDHIKTITDTGGNVMTQAKLWPHLRLHPKRTSQVTIRTPHNHLYTQDPPSKHSMRDSTRTDTIQFNQIHTIWGITKFIYLFIFLIDNNEFIKENLKLPLSA